MIQSLAKILPLIAIVAISIGTKTSVADDAGIVRISDQTFVESECADHACSDIGCSNHGCDHGYCQGHDGCHDGKIVRCRKCRGNGRVCRVSGYCDGCGRGGRGAIGRIFGHFGRQCGCDVCRAGRRGHGGYDGYGGRDGLSTYFKPNGCGGKGCPPFGAYQMVYPVNPDHFDPRDGQVHAAQGYNVPMAVPLAPVVRHQYNYSWGVPASRITHISNHAPHRLHGPDHGYPGHGFPPMGAHQGAFPGH